MWDQIVSWGAILFQIKQEEMGYTSVLNALELC